MSVAVTVRLPAVLSVTLKVCVPAHQRGVRPAGVAFGVARRDADRVGGAVTTFQFASTALTVTLNAVPAV